MKAKIWKLSKRTIQIALLIGTIFLVNLLWFKPLFINHFYDRVFIKFGLQNPQIFSSMGYKFYYDELNDNSQAADDESIKFLNDSSQMLHQYDRSKLSGQKLISYDVLDFFLQDIIDDNKFKDYGYSQTQRGGNYQSIINFMSNMHRIDNESDAEDYISRISQIGLSFDNTLIQVAKEQENGVIPPDFIITKILENLHNIRDPELAENELVKDFNKKLDKVTDLDSDSRAQLHQKMIAQMQEVVIPAYDRMISFYAELLTEADSKAGVWKFPNGAEYYQFRVKSSTTSDYTPEYLHELGLKEVTRIVRQIKTILIEQGYDVESKEIGQILNDMSKDPQFLYADNEEGRTKILKDYQIIINEIDKEMSETFGVLPTGKVVVKRVPEFREKTAAGGSYSSPSKNGERPGTFYANLYDVTATPKFGMRTLAYHEAVPGHHFQLAIQNELQGLPIFRSMIGFTGFTEGWALYAERLAAELGFQEDPFDDIGRLQAELLRAVRLVVDTGIHHKRWSREQAIKYMAETTGFAMTDVVSEIERYIVWPGQALAYKVGMIKIIELREKAKNDLKDKYDVKEFHTTVLKNGALPLTMLEEQINIYIAETLNKS
ncbi:MAG: DUF885 domain-containing protein [Alcanivoracaceae bacterium]|nr:DUF885 domain-containing protein [Alcanivoracaceae bacterium]